MKILYQNMIIQIDIFEKMSGERQLRIITDRMHSDYIMSGGTQVFFVPFQWKRSRLRWIYRDSKVSRWTANRDQMEWMYLSIYCRSCRGVDDRSYFDLSNREPFLLSQWYISFTHRVITVRVSQLSLERRYRTRSHREIHTKIEGGRWGYIFVMYGKIFLYCRDRYRKWGRDSRISSTLRYYHREWSWYKKSKKVHEDALYCFFDISEDS